MKKVTTHSLLFSTGSCCLILLAIGISGVVRDARAADPADCPNRREPKNLMSPSYRFPATCAAAPQELTKKEVKKLIATAESPEDHLKIARYYRAEADRLDAQGAGYEEAAADIRRGPMVKNLVSPTTPARYEYLAKGFREEAQSDRKLAASQEQMAGSSVASLSRN